MQVGNVEKWDRKKLQKYINQNQVDFVARCSSQWHVLAIDAFINKILSSTNKNISGVLYVCPRDDKYLLSDKNIQLSNKIDYKLVYGTAISVKEKIVQTLSCLFRTKKHWHNNKKIYVIAPDSSWSFLIDGLDSDAYFPVSVIIEDGFAHYNSKEVWIKESKNLKQRVVTSVQFKMIELVNRKLNIEENYFTLFDKKNGMKKNDEVIFYFKKSLLSRHNKKNRNCARIKCSSILFLSQPLVEDGHISFNDLQQFYEQIYNVLGERLSIKIHPRDKTTNKIECIRHLIIMDNNMNAEELLLCCDNTPDVVIGFNSTSLITYNLFFQIRAKSLNHLIYDKIIGDYLKLSFKNFEDIFSSQIDFVDSFDELMQ